MTKILIKCEGCKTEFKVNRTEEIPENCTYLTCNWPKCEDDAEDYYNEEYKYDELPEEPNPDQSKLEL